MAAKKCHDSYCRRLLASLEIINSKSWCVCNRIQKCVTFWVAWSGHVQSEREWRRRERWKELKWRNQKKLRQVNFEWRLISDPVTLKCHPGCHKHTLSLTISYSDLHHRPHPKSGWSTIQIKWRNVFKWNGNRNHCDWNIWSSLSKLNQWSIIIIILETERKKSSDVFSDYFSMSTRAEEEFGGEEK